MKTVFSSATRLKTQARLCAFLLVAFIAFGLTACQQGNESGVKRPSDEQITSAVKTQLQGNDEIQNLSQADIATRDGIVTFDGDTDNLLAKQLATQLAENVKGVRSVVNNLKITTTRPDSDIKTDVDEALSTDPATEDMKLNTSVDNGLVTIKGVSDSWQASKLVEHIVKGVKGVQEVQNNLIVHFNADRLTRDIKSEVQHMLRWDARLDDAQINVNVTDDKVVKLSGKVGSAYQKDLAMQVAHVRGVKDVQADELEVEPSITSAMRRDIMAENINSGQISSAIKDAMKYDPRVTAKNVQVEVEDGVVSLSGTVFNLNEKLAAGQDAKNTMGVKKLNNDIKVERRVVVRPKTPTTDQAITERVKSIFSRDPYVSPAGMEVHVNDGVVTLSGTTQSNFLKKHYKELASNVKGVIAVQSDITVSSSESTNS